MWKQAAAAGSTLAKTLLVNPVMRELLRLLASSREMKNLKALGWLLLSVSTLLNEPTTSHRKLPTLRSLGKVPEFEEQPALFPELSSQAPGAAWLQKKHNAGRVELQQHVEETAGHHDAAAVERKLDTITKEVDHNQQQSSVKELFEPMFALMLELLRSVTRFEAATYISHWLFIVLYSRPLRRSHFLMASRVLKQLVEISFDHAGEVSTSSSPRDVVAALDALAKEKRFQDFLHEVLQQLA